MSKYECRRCGKSWKTTVTAEHPDKVCKRCGEIVGPTKEPMLFRKNPWLADTEVAKKS